MEAKQSCFKLVIIRQNWNNRWLEYLFSSIFRLLAKENSKYSHYSPCVEVFFPNDQQCGNPFHAMAPSFLWLYSEFQARHLVTPIQTWEWYRTKIFSENPNSFTSRSRLELGLRTAHKRRCYFVTTSPESALKIHIQYALSCKHVATASQYYS